MAKILHTIGGLHPNTGGPARTVTSLCAHLAELRKFQICLLSQKLVGDEIYFGSLDQRNLLVAETSSKICLKSGYLFYTKLAHRVSQCKPDIIHDHGIWLPTNHVAAKIARKDGIPYVVHTRGMLEPWAITFRGFKKRLAWHFYQRTNLQLATLFFATSEKEAENIRELGFRQPVAVIPNGTNSNVTDLRFRSNLPSNRERNVVFLGRIHPIKGLKMLVEAWSQVDYENWKLILAGPDETGFLKDVLEAASVLGVKDRVSYIGQVDGREKASLLEKADIFILPSFSENFGLVVAEALSYGVPVISTKGTPWKGLEDSGCGWWVDAESKALVLALNEALSLNDTERFQMGTRGREYARQFDWDDIASKTAEVYHWVLQGGSPPECIRLS